MILECASCDALVDTKSEGSYVSVNPEDMIQSKYTLAKCPNCWDPMVAVEESFGPDREGPHWEKPVRLYPPRASTLASSFPASVREAYDEARKCYRAKAFAAGAIMCRKCLEAMCHEHGVAERNLARGLEKLKDQEVIEARLFEWGEALRIAGNEAAHDVSTSISPEDAKDLLEFTEALLQYVFTFRERFDDFMKRRAVTEKRTSKKAKKPTAPPAPR